MGDRIEILSVAESADYLEAIAAGRQPSARNVAGKRLVDMGDSTVAEVVIARNPLGPLAIQVSTTDAATGAIAVGDCVHTTILQFANATLVAGGTGTVSKFLFHDKDDQAAPGELWLFNDTVTIPAADAAWSLSDADLAKCVGVIPFGPYFDATLGQIAVNSSVRLRYTCAATTLFGALKTLGTPTYTAPGPTVTLFVDRD